MKELYEISKPQAQNWFDNPGKLFAELFDYFEWAKENRRPFTIQGVHAFLGVSAYIWNEWKAEENKDHAGIIGWTEAVLEEEKNK